jgi:hypothetical protein
MLLFSRAFFCAFTKSKEDFCITNKELTFILLRMAANNLQKLNISGKKLTILLNKL